MARKPDRRRNKNRRPNKKRKPKKSPLIDKSIELQMIDMAHGGSAIGRHEGKIVFVPYTIPGEAIIAKITGDSGKVLFGQGEQLLAASADRVTPSCIHFGQGRCWSCHWQHINYETQLLLKQDVLADQLSRLGKIPDSVLESAMRPVAPAQDEWDYNFRMTLTRSKDDEWGYLRQNGWAVEPLQECHIVHPELLALYEELDLDYERAKRMTLQRGTDGQMMVIFEITEEEEPELTTDLALSVNLILPDNEPINLIGDSYSTFHIGERDFRVTAGGSIRPNVGQIEFLMIEVMKRLKLTGKERVLDLYAGVGIYSAFIAPRCELVTLVESYPPAVTDADVNLMDFENIDVIEGQVETVLDDMIEEEAEYDTALVDPPTSGLATDVVKQLSQLGVKRVVYVSGDPASLARDSQLLISTCFSLVDIQPIDLSPQTYYIDSVALFER
jgi:23S rRNA (uracil1939-C5)-methyltransferase